MGVPSAKDLFYVCRINSRMTTRNPRRGRGRPPGTSTTRRRIEDAARAQFAAAGYSATTIRSVAAEAGVDPALVMHYHGSKQGLFKAALSLPFDPRPLVEELAAGDRATVGRRLADAVLAAFSDPHTQRVLLGRIRAASSEAQAAPLVRAQITNDIVWPLAQRLGVDQPGLRAGMVSSQLVGWAVARWILGFEELAAQPIDDAAVWLGETFQRYLTGPIGGPSR
jgi:AcrR family transcriptional regulator